MSSPKILLLDIETAPIKAYTWGLFDQNINPVQIIDHGYMLSWAAKWFDKKEIMFDSIFNHKKEFKANPKSDEKIAKSIWPIMDEADIILAHNGDNYDLKWLNMVFLKHNMKPASTFKSIDTFRVVKSSFRFESNKLEEIGKFLGCGQKVEHEGFPLWVKCMHGDEKAWKKMEQYNKHDVVLLEKVYEKIRPFIKNHPNLALYHDGSKPICPNCAGDKFSKKGFAYTFMNKYQRYVCNNCGKNVRGRKPILTKDQTDNILNNCI